MAGNALEEDQTLIRWVRKNSLRRDEDLNVIGINPDAFEHRLGEDYLSATWQEHLHADPALGLQASIAMFRQCLKINRKDGYAIGGVGPIRLACSDFGAQVRVLHEPDPPNHAHVALRRVPKDNSELRARLAASEWAQFVLDADFPLEIPK